MITTVTLSTQSSLLQRQRVVTLLNPLVGAGQVVTAATAQAVIAYDAATAAAASEVAAEAARDAAQLSAGVYVDTTAGLAATVSGDYFSVPSVSSDEYLILYKNNAGVAALVQTYPSAAALTTALTGAQTARTGAELAETNAETAQSAAELARDESEAARDASYSAAQSAGVYIYDTKAAADAAVGALADLSLVEVLADETQGGIRTRYRKQSGVLVLKISFFGGVRYDTAAQSLTATQQQNAQANLGFGGSVVFAPSVVGSGDHLLVRNKTPNSATRVHQEPNGYVDTGTVTKWDWMFDPYDSDSSNYRIVNIYAKVGNGTGLNGENGAAVLGLKAVGDHFGVWPSLHVGFSDDGETGVPMKLYYFDTSDTVWRTPMKGAWRTGRAYTSGDYALAGNKLYQASTTGTSGATKPSHAAGTVSDGAVDWLFVRNYGSVSGNIKPLVLIGDRDDMPKFGLPDIRMQFSKAVAFWNGIAAKFLNSAGALAWKIGIRSLGNDLYIENEAGTAGLRLASNFMQKIGLANLLSTSTVSTAAAVPDVTGAELIILNFGSATNVTGFSGHARQLLVVRSTNGNVTLVNSASLQTSTGANKTLTANSCLMFLADGGGTSWIEVGKL